MQPDGKGRRSDSEPRKNRTSGGKYGRGRCGRIRRALSVERSSVIRGAVPWSVRPVVPLEDFFVDYSGARRPAMPTNSLCNGV
jgi:hypothetical protein